MQSHPQSAVVATAAGWLAVLQEEDPALRHAALRQLHAHCDQLWHEMAPALPDLEAMAEDTANESRALAAAVASKVLFYLQESEQALKWALLTVHTEYDCFHTSGMSSPYTTTLIAAALDAYIQLQQQEQQQEDGTAADKDEETWTVEQLRPMVHRLLQVSCANGHHEYAVGIALEACELPMLEEILVQSGPSIKLLQYAVKSVSSAATSSSSNSHKPFRTAALQVLAKHWDQLFRQQDKSVCYDLVHLWHTLQQPEQVAAVLATLLGSGDHADGLTALQLAFDLQDTGHHAFVTAVADELTKTVTDESVTAAILKVLTGGFASELRLSFLHKQSRADRRLMEGLKKGVEAGSSRPNAVLHNAAVVSHSYLYAGTTNDSFLRDYLDWMKKAGNW